VTVSNEVISERVCSKCSTEVRAESRYCYHCGGEVGAEGSNPSAGSLSKPAQNGAGTSKLDDSIVDSTSVPRNTNQRRRRERKRVHVVWEQSDGPGYLLLVFAAAVALVVIVMLAVASYLQ